MAAVAGPLGPDQSFSSMLVTAFDKGPTFIVQNKVTVSSNDEDGMPEDLLKDKFILDDKCFVNLQVYLKSAMNLPGTKEDFEKSFPQDLFKEYFEADEGEPKLYGFMRDTLVGVNDHCEEFWKDCMGPIVSLAGKIANFCDEAKMLGDDLYQQLTIITRQGATTNDKDVQTALQRAGRILKDLKDESDESSKACEQYVLKLSAFQVTTEQDKNNVNKVSTRTTKCLPSNQKLDADLREKMDAATEQMQQAVNIAAENTEKAKNNSGFKWYYCLPTWPISLGLFLYDNGQKENALHKIRMADREYQKVLEIAGGQMKAIISLRANCSSLQKVIKNVQEAIAKAQSALEHMKSAFSRLQTDIEFISKRLQKIDDKMIDADAYQRERSLKEFDGARWRWVLVKNLAHGFQQKGLLVEANLQTPEPSSAQDDQLEVLGSTFGGDNVTKAAKVLFNDGFDMLIDSTKMPFVDNWKGMEKTVTMLYSYGKEKRLFICGERTGEHKIKRGSIALSQNATSVQSIIIPKPKPDGALYQILAIVYGKQEVNEEKSYNYVYQQMNSRQKVQWSNDNFPDGWCGNSKSGVVYYTTDGKDVKLLAGKEGEETAWH